MKLGTVLNKSIHIPPTTTDSLILTHAKVGVEVELENWDGTNPFTWWENHRDDSLRNNGQEFTTRGGLSGQALINAVAELTSKAKESGWSEGYPRAGIHVHIDCTDLDVEKGELATFMSMYMLVEHAMFSWCGEWRRSCGFCDSLEDSTHDFNSLGRALYDQTGAELRALLRAEGFCKYQAVNLMSLDKFGTLEFRQLPTTFDYDRIVEWINIIMQLKQAATEYENTMPLLAKFSREGATAFVRNMMGKMWPAIEGHFLEHRAWAAVDNAMALMSYGRVLVASVEGEGDPWSEDNNLPSPVAQAKIDAIKKSRQPAKKKPVPQPLLQPNDVVRYWSTLRIGEAPLETVRNAGYELHEDSNMWVRPRDADAYMLWRLSHTPQVEGVV